MSIFDNFRRQSQRRLSPLQPVGFHGDKYLMSLVDNIMQSVHVFIETGTNVGSTITYVARTYPTTRLAGVSIYNETSKTFMERLEQEHDYLFEEKILFWLDAHGYGFKWPLREEVNFITTKFSSAYILIDDFKVPGLDCFGFDSYKDQESSFEYLRTALSSKQEYAIYYPAYTEKTSTFHPLRGWGLIVLGPQNDIGILESMGDKIQRDKSAS
jgi:hypothetical protein